MIKKRLTFEDLEFRYIDFCKNFENIKENIYWKTGFDKYIEKDHKKKCDDYSTKSIRNRRFC